MEQLCMYNKIKVHVYNFCYYSDIITAQNVTKYLKEYTYNLLIELESIANSQNYSWAYFGTIGASSKNLHTEADYVIAIKLWALLCFSYIFSKKPERNY